MEAVISFLMSVVLTVQTVFALLPVGAKGDLYSPEGENVILNCAVVSDTHADSNALRDRTNILRRAFAGIGGCSEKIDVLLNIGDITNSGVNMEYHNLKRLERVYLKAENIVACLGNHDSWHESADPDYEAAAKLFKKYLKHNGIESNEVYYSTVIDGYHFICLGTECFDHDENLPLYSRTQLDWFEAELTESEKSGLPVFVLSHIPVSGRNGISGTTLPAEVDAILRSHSSYDKPILFFSGHYHDFTPDIFEQDGNICYINMPSLEYNDETEYECNDKGGEGMTMEVYENKIVLRARNFISNEWTDGYRFEVDF